MKYQNCVNFPHQALSFGEGNDDFLVVYDVFVSERAVFESFLRGLVVTDVEESSGFRGSWHDEGNQRLAFQKAQSSKCATESDQFAELFFVRRIKYGEKIIFKNSL